LARVVIAAGGTGGHVYPGIALAHELRAAGHEVCFIGGDRLETRLVPEAGFELHRLPAVGLPRRDPVGAARAGAGAARSILRARAVLRSFRAQVVVGMGGYASSPPCLAARWLRLPVVLHEQNARLTLANKISLLSADILVLSLELEERPWRRNVPTEIAGSPLREPVRLMALSDEAGRSDLRASARAALGLGDTPTLLVFGGSQGALALNRALPRAAAGWTGRGNQVLHITGPDHIAEALRAWAGAPGVVCVAYCDAMEQAYAAADAVLCRSGASTLAEVAALGLPSVLVPYPFERYQSANAAVLGRAGGAIVTDQNVGPLEPRLADALSRLEDEAVRRSMGDRARELGRPGAAGRLREIVESQIMRRPA
jgi:undecaprenyldiphospho-muramoylpentapeptide beta-N-acetylglucosaminyltransferase